MWYGKTLRKGLGRGGGSDPAKSTTTWTSPVMNTFIVGHHSLSNKSIQLKLLNSPASSFTCNFNIILLCAHYHNLHTARAIKMGLSLCEVFPGIDIWITSNMSVTPKAEA